MKMTCFIAVLLVTITACRQHAAPPPTTYANDSITFFPVQDYLAAQIKEVDSVPYFIYCLRQSSAGKDSTVLNREAFDKATLLFTRYNISDTAVKKYYKESVFGDESTNSNTLHYATENKDLPVQSIDVLLKPDDQKVKRIFITTIENRNDSTIVTRLGWKQHESCSISTSISHNGKTSDSQSTIVWNGQN